MTPLALYALLIGVAMGQKDPNFVPGHNAIVHLFEWKWSDIADECERFLSKKGFGGVQISPPNENVIIQNRPWYERYQPVSYQLVTRSGDEAALADMIRRCNAVGVRIYPDAVINHMAATGGQGTASNNCDPNQKSYPAVPYSNENFHQSCPINNYNDAANVRNCELVNLKDLDQSQQYVRQKIIDYMNHLIDLGVAGFRVDAAKHIWPADLQAIYGSLKNLNTEHGFKPGSRAFMFQEVNDIGSGAVQISEYTGFGNIVEFKVGVELGRAFQGHNQLKYLKNWGPEWGLANGLDAVPIIDNHDTQRDYNNDILTNRNPKPYKMAVAFMLAHPYGTPKIMSSFGFDNKDNGPPSAGPGINADGTCSNGWVCEHRWRQIYNMVGFRNAVEGTSVANWWSNDDNQIAFSRGNKGFVAFTLSGNIDQTLQTGLPSGNYCDVITGNLENGSCTGKTVNVDGSGNAHIQLRQDEEDGVLAIHVNAKL